MSTTTRTETSTEVLLLRLEGGRIAGQMIYCTSHRDAETIRPAGGRGADGPGDRP